MKTTIENIIKNDYTPDVSCIEKDGYKLTFSHKKNRDIGVIVEKDKMEAKFTIPIILLDNIEIVDYLILKFNEL